MNPADLLENLRALRGRVRNQSNPRLNPHVGITMTRFVLSTIANNSARCEPPVTSHTRPVTKYSKPAGATC